MQFKTQKEAKEIIQRSIDTNDRAVLKAVKIIAGQQTASELACKTTIEHNNVGFGAFGAEFLTSIAEQVRYGRKLTPKQMAMTRTKIRCYWRQLATLSGGLPPPKRK